jgi:lipopolysaccharide transport system permease protein
MPTASPKIPNINQSSKSALSAACSDLHQGLMLYALWMHLAHVDIKQRYRRSFLGPFWITLSMAIFISAFGLVYSRLFKQNIADYIPFLTTGYLTWNMLSCIMIESCDAFEQNKSIILGIKLPISIHLYRTIWRNIIIFFHNIIVFMIVFVYFHMSLSWHMLLFFPAFLLASAALTLASLLISFVSTRFRDIPPIIMSLMQVAFFVSPVSWKPSMIGHESMILIYNPFTYYLDLLRNPLLGLAPNPTSWYVVITLTIFLFLCTVLCLARYRRFIPYWL